MVEEGEVEEGRKKASQQITIDQVRALDSFFNVGTHRAGLQDRCRQSADAMNRNTANALLKTLEEPAPGTLFLMVSSEPLRLLPTIRSRCQVVPLRLPSAAAKRILAADGIRQPARWLALAGGSPAGFANWRLRGEGLARAIAEASWRWRATRLADRLAADLEKIVKESKGKLALKSVVEAMQKWLVDLTLASNGLPVRYFLAQQATISGLADMIPPARLVRAYRVLLKRRREAEQPLNARLFLEGLFMDYRSLLRQ
jgi:DNA polymerase-3 subunit delta'